MTLYFVRHGQTEAVARNVYSDPHTPLTELGRQQARAAAAQLTRPGLLVSSPFTRARETAVIIAQALGYPQPSIVLDDRLREVGMGPFVGTPDRGLPFYLEQATLASTGVEPLAEAEARIQGFLDDLGRRSESPVVVVGHAGSGRILQAILEHRLDQLAALPEPANGQVMTFTLEAQI